MAADGNDVELNFPIALTQGLRSVPLYRGMVLTPGLIKRGVSWRIVGAVNSAFEFSQDRSSGKKIIPDIYHRTYYSSSGNFLNAPEVITVYDMIHEDFPQYFRKSIFNEKIKSIQRASQVICISEYTRNRLIELVDIDPDLVSTIPLGIEHVASADNRARNNSESPYILYIGSRGGYKNFSVLELAFSELVQMHRDLKLFLIGGGPITDHELTRFQKLGIDKNVCLTRPNQYVEELVSNAQCVVSTSLVEGFGLVPLEALSQGIPCVISDIEVNREIWGDSLPVFSPDSHLELTFEIQKLLESDEHWREVSQKGSAIARNLTAEKMAKATLHVYDQVLDQD